MKNNRILCYTRLPQDEMIYSKKLAYSMHLAYEDEKEEYVPLNLNSGILYAKATSNENGTMNAKSIKAPYLFALHDGSYGVIAVRTTADGEHDAESIGRAIVFQTKDFIHYDEIRMIDFGVQEYVEDVVCEYDAVGKQYQIRWKSEDGSWYQVYTKDILTKECLLPSKKCESYELPKVTTTIEGAVVRNTLSIPFEVYDKLVKKLSVPEMVQIQFPECVVVSNEQEIKDIGVYGIYSNGTVERKHVEWDTTGIDFSKDGEYVLQGRVRRPHFKFPLAENRADPCAYYWNGKYYFIATNDTDGNRSLYVRESDTFEGIQTAKEVLILDTNTYDHVKGLLWAPEFHTINGDLYIFHGATQGEFFEEECHVMKLKQGGNPTCASDWSEPKRVLKKDGSYLCEAGKTISLDMTYFSWENECYVVWSQRQFIPDDLGAWLYIAKVDENQPWILTTDPVVISKPEYGWANNHVFVDEGPYAIKRNGRLILTFSSALVDATYVVGMMTLEGENLLDCNSWRKCNYPILSSRNVEGEYGPGHNSYFEDEYGELWSCYHARNGINGPRSSGIRRVHFDMDQEPYLGMTEEKDVKEQFRNLKINVSVSTII